jgi:hypothetical protein
MYVGRGMNGFFSTIIGGSIKAAEIGIPAAATGGGSLIATGAIAGASVAAGAAAKKILGKNGQPQVAPQPVSAFSQVPLWGWIVGGIAGLALVASL